MDAFSLAMDYISWHNFGNEYFVIIGRDMGYFLIGYLTCFIISCFVECFRRKKCSGCVLMSFMVAASRSEE